MKIISHRGNLEGPCPEENSSALISKALEAGYEVEIDVRSIEGKMYLGHDTPDEEVDVSFINRYDFWVHAKNLEAMHALTEGYFRCNYFWHQQDDFALTSGKYIWTYPGKETCNKTILVALTKEEVDTAIEKKPFAICTDYPNYAKEVMNRKEVERRYSSYVELCVIESAPFISYAEFCHSIKNGKCEYCIILKDTNCDCTQA